MNIPRHVAVIMDGNGRWAKKNNKTRLAGHDAGMKAMKGIIRECGRLGIEHLTVYAFSTENWKRSRTEVSGIFSLVVKYMKSELGELMENNVACDVLGDYSSLPRDAVAALDKLKLDTGGNTGLKLHIALNYGSRADITDAVKKLARAALSRAEVSSADGAGAVKKVARTALARAEVSGADVADVADGASAFAEAQAYIDGIAPDDVAAHLSTGGACEPDLLIRTGGEQRLSNFLLWEVAYSEFVFTDTLWPDFTPEEFRSCLEEYSRRSRRFGGR